jgi:hypothetical protein
MNDSALWKPPKRPRSRILLRPRATQQITQIYLAHARVVESIAVIGGGTMGGHLISAPRSCTLLHNAE